MARVAAIVSDLMLASRVTTSLGAAGHEVQQSSSIPEGLDADLIVADLDTVAPEDLAGTGVPAIGFYSHVDVDMKSRAEDAGIAMAVPRSRMARELPDLVEKVLAQGAGS